MSLKNLVVFLGLPLVVFGQGVEIPAECSTEPDYGTCDDQQHGTFYNQTSGACEWFVYSGCGGNGVIFESYNDCLHECTCNMPADSGPCMAYFPSFYFNPSSGECEQFIYGGCGGNQNNFRTKSQCEHECVCSRMSDSGDCRASIGAYFFDVEENKCAPFTYGGCGGNVNRFNDEKACNDRCVCNQDKEAGNCYAYMPSVYYDADDGQCKDFVYGGCGGNGNRFYSQDSCQETCSQPS